MRAVTTEAVVGTAGPDRGWRRVWRIVRSLLEQACCYCKKWSSAVSFIDNFLLVVSDTLFFAEILELGREKVKGFTFD